MKKKIIIILFIITLALASSIFYMYESRDYSIKEIYIKNDSNQKIFARIYKPKKNKKMPIVIYSHGLGASYRAGIDYAKELVKYDIATITFDFRGGRNNNNSDGSSKDMSFLTEMDDLETIIDYVKKLDFVDKDQIILMGSSQGGAISALISAKRDDIKGTVLLYPALSIPTHARYRFSNKNDIPKSIKMTNNITVGSKYFLDIWDMDVYTEIKKDEKQILILQGTKDNLVSPEHSKMINNIYKNSELFLIKGAGHGFDGKHFEEAMIHIIDYLKNIKIIK
ncbi:MAG: alpha/beta hydrolase [Bacilli bacterium]|nr:alpha/beta hydrolase [Bacilli bacterium]